MHNITIPRVGSLGFFGIGRSIARPMLCLYRFSALPCTKLHLQLKISRHLSNGKLALVAGLPINKRELLQHLSKAEPVSLQLHSYFWLKYFQCPIWTHEKYYGTNIKSRIEKDSTSSDHESVSIDSLGTWGNTFELPLQMDTSIQYGKPIPCIVASDVGHFTNVGKRKYQEDRYFIKDIGDNLLCCAVFDGHGGTECSNFCAENIKAVLERNMKTESDLESVLHHTILELNDMYCKWSRDNSKGERIGSTCTICLIKDGLELVIGHVGDSRLLLCRRGRPRRLTNDHCPSNISEMNRVTQSGGTVDTDHVGRHMVNSALSMSRSIGDLYLKPFGVIALPDTRRIQIKHVHDSFILLLTDGISFVLNDEEICDVVNHAQDPHAAAHSLIDQALSMSSEDNQTALVVPLGSWGKFAKSASSMFYSFGIGRNMSKSSRFG